MWDLEGRSRAVAILQLMYAVSYLLADFTDRAAEGLPLLHLPHAPPSASLTPECVCV